MKFLYDESEISNYGIFKTFAFDEGRLTLRIYSSIAGPFISLSWADDETPINDAERVSKIKDEFCFMMKLYRYLSMKIPTLTSIDGESLHSLLDETLEVYDV